MYKLIKDKEQVTKHSIVTRPEEIEIQIEHETYKEGFILSKEIGIEQLAGNILNSGLSIEMFIRCYQIAKDTQDSNVVTISLDRLAEIFNLSIEDILILGKSNIVEYSCKKLATI